MLLLGRRVGEKIVMPERGITITVLGIQGNRIHLGIEAPRDTSVYREEIWQRIQREVQSHPPAGLRKEPPYRERRADPPPGKKQRKKTAPLFPVPEADVSPNPLAHPSMGS